MAISATHKNNTRNCNKEFWVRWKACSFIQASQGGGEVHKPRRYITWKIPPPPPALLLLHTSFYPGASLSMHSIFSNLCIL